MSAIPPVLALQECHPSVLDLVELHLNLQVSSSGDCPPPTTRDEFTTLPGSCCWHGKYSSPQGLSQLMPACCWRPSRQSRLDALSCVLASPADDDPERVPDPLRRLLGRRRPTHGGCSLTSEQVLASMDYSQVQIWWSALAMVALFALYRVLFLLALKVQTLHVRN